MSYKPPHKYTEAELDDAALRDLLNDAKCAEEQAASGPFYPEPGITKDSLLAYAAKCHSEAAEYANGGAHGFLLHPNKAIKNAKDFLANSGE